MLDRIEVNVANESVSPRTRWIVDAIHPDIDHNGASANHVGGYQARASGSDDENVGAFGVKPQVSRVTMTNSHSSVCANCVLHEKRCHRLSDNVAPTDYHTLSSRCLDT